MFCSTSLLLAWYWMGSINLVKLFTVNCISSVLSINTATLEFFWKKHSRTVIWTQGLEASMLITMPSDIKNLNQSSWLLFGGLVSQSCARWVQSTIKLFLMCLFHKQWAVTKSWQHQINKRLEPRGGRGGGAGSRSTNANRIQGYINKACSSNHASKRQSNWVTYKAHIF